MADIRCERQDQVLVIRLGRGKANAINRNMVEELNAAVEEAARDETIRGLVLASDRENFFSSGFDVHEVFRYDRETMSLFFARFIDLYESLYLLPKPVVAAVNGHAYAGGAILAVSCDLRILAHGDFGFALNEVNLGVVLPPGLTRIVTSIVGAPYARELLLWGDVIHPQRALAIGLANELVPPGKVQERAVERCVELARKPAGAFAAVKHTLREIAGYAPEGADRETLDDFIRHWFSGEAEEGKKKLLAVLTAKQ